ncbi:MAG: hypothetical protein LBG76_06900 [Treponema sp.]|jgi:NAD(P)H-hydrate epimerase|nr:hypothetical protein [Treponema sp.]
MNSREKLLSPEDSQALDAEAAASWGLDPFALVEAAGRNCARFFIEAYPDLFSSPLRVTAVAGGGNNGADALVMLRSLIFMGKASPDSTAAILSRPCSGERSPRTLAALALEKMGVPLLLWEGAAVNSCRERLSCSDLIIDGIAGTGLKGPLEGAPEAMVGYINALPKGNVSKGKIPFVVSIDTPSGNSASWKEGMPVLQAQATLGIEPLKEPLYRPALRRFAGNIIPVGELFPAALTGSYGGAELFSWQTVRREIPRILPTAYKHERGVVEIRAGSPGFPGAARIAGRGAQAAGAGLVRLVVDEAVYPLLAASAGGVIVQSAAADVALKGAPFDSQRFVPDAVLLGPGWGKSPDRAAILEQAAVWEAEGTPLILDADAIALAGDRRFHGRAILTPHPGEFAAYSGIPRERLLENPAPYIGALARERGIVVLFKGHVTYIACPQGRLGVVDGMAPVLAAGGSGDLLAGFCAALAARTSRLGKYDGFICAAAAAALLTETANAPEIIRRFCDPLELADAAARLAGDAWL